MLEYCTGLHLVGWGKPSLIAAITSRMSESFQAHSPRNGLFKREPDIVGTNASRDRHIGLRTLLRYLANSF